MVLSKKEMGRKIKEARKKKSEEMGLKYTQQMLADELDISRGYLGDIEAGRTYPNYVLLSKIANSCRVPLNFFGEESSIGDMIRQIREERGLSQEDFSNMVGISIDVLKKIENDEFKTFSGFLEYLAYNTEEQSKKTILKVKEEELIYRYRQLPSVSQQTVLSLIDNLEIIDKTKNEQTATESEVG